MKFAILALLFFGITQLGLAESSQIDASSWSQMQQDVKDYATSIKDHADQNQVTLGQAGATKFNDFDGISTGTFISDWISRFIDDATGETCNGKKDPTTDKANPSHSIYQYYIPRIEFKECIYEIIEIKIHLDAMVPSTFHLVVEDGDDCAISIHMDFGPEYRWPVSTLNAATEMRAAYPQILLSALLSLNDTIQTELASVYPLDLTLAKTSASIGALVAGGDTSAIGGTLNGLTSSSGSNSSIPKKAVDDLHKIDADKRYVGIPGAMEISTIMDLIMTDELDQLPHASKYQLSPRDLEFGYLLSENMTTSAIGSLLSSKSRSRATKFLFEGGNFGCVKNNMNSHHDIKERFSSDHSLSQMMSGDDDVDCLNGIGLARFPYTANMGYQMPSDKVLAAAFQAHYLSNLISQTFGSVFQEHTYYSQVDPFRPAKKGGAIAEKTPSCSFEESIGNAPWNFGQDDDNANARTLGDTRQTVITSLRTFRGSTHKKKPDSKWDVNELLGTQANTKDDPVVRDDEDDSPNDYE